MYFEWNDFQDSTVDLVPTTTKCASDPQIHNGRKHEDNSNKYSSGNYNSGHNSSRTNQTEDHRTSSLQSLSIGEIMEAPDADNMGVSAILNYCKCKILRPYLRLLSVIGLRPISLDITDANWCISFLSNFYTFLVIILLLFGYLLQFMACFRRDRGFCYTIIPILMGKTLEDVNYHQICYGSVSFSYIIPTVLHFGAYLYSLYLFRVSNNEQLQSTMERVFLLSCGPQDGSTGQRSLLRTLWIFIGCSIFWMLLSLVTVIVMIENGNITFQWMQNRVNWLTYPEVIFSADTFMIIMKTMLIICTFFHDMVQASVICSYCIQAQLLRSHLNFLRIRLMQSFISPLEWMREVGEFRKSLNYLNDGLAPAVCIFTIMNLSWSASGVLWLIHLDSTDVETKPIMGISYLNVLIWVIISLAPFLQASRLTASCIALQTVGHDIRTRPLVYQATPVAELDSILLYASSLRINAKLFKVPITGRCLLLTITVMFIVVLTLGQCHYFQIPE